MSRRRLFLFSGLGGDHRLLDKIRPAGAEVVSPDHIAPLPGESLTEYAARLAKEHRIGPADAVGGASFGGMIAAEIARGHPVAGLVLLGSCIRPETMPRSYRLLESLGSLIPDWALDLRSLRPLVRWRFSPISREGEDCIMAMATDCPPERIREFGRMLMAWMGVRDPGCPVLAIHGDRDKIIPPACAEDGLLLSGAGHSFTLTHPEETNSAIEGFLSALR